MGKGGAGLSFLNKKTWHPGRMQNQERLWKAEEDAAAEVRSLEELRKKIAEERSREELKEAAVTGGHQKAADRIDWMYSGGMMAKAEADKRSEDAMLGVAPIEAKEEDKEVTRIEQATLLPSFYAEDTPVAANETWARLHSDPLFAIRQQEQSARKQVVANPAQMQAIKKQVQTLKDAAAAKKAAKRAAKDDKKAEKHAKKQRKADKVGKGPVLGHTMDHSPVGPLSHGGNGDGQREPPAKRQRRSRSPEQFHRHLTDDRDFRHSGGANQSGTQAGRYDRAHPSDRSYNWWHGDNRRHRPDNGRDNGYDRRDDRHDERREDGRGSRGDERNSRHYERRADRRDVKQEDGGYTRPDLWCGTRGNEQLVKQEAVDDHDITERPRQASNDAGPARTEAAEQGSHGAEDIKGVGRRLPDGASAQGAGLQYGLTANQHQDSDRSTQAAATRERLVAADQAKKEADRMAKLTQGQRRSHTTGRLTAEERAAKLAQMTGNALEHEGSRSSRLKHAAKADAVADAAEAVGGRTAHHTDTERFMKTVTKDVYGAEAGGGSLEERVARRKYYNERGIGATDRNAFRRD